MFNLFKNKHSSKIPLKDGKIIIVKKLKEITIPKIKDIGFTGSFPHFRRKIDEKYEFLSFQFNSYGGSFVVEVSSGTEKDIPEFAKELPFEKLNYTYFGNRMRIKPDNTKGDFWFTYEDFTEEKQFEDLSTLVTSLFPKIEAFFAN